VAYRQPATRADIDQLRGVNSDRAVATLLTHGLIEEVGRRETVGRPVLFATTLQLLERMGIGSLSELPSLEELAAMEPGESQADSSR
jgi:segregation and condensation protein B